MGKVADSLHAKLVAALAPTHLDIVDDSARHAGHADIIREMIDETTGS